MLMFDSGAGFNTAACPMIRLQRQLDGPVSNRGAGHLAPLRQLTSLNLGGRSVMTAHALGYLQSFTGLQSL